MLLLLYLYIALVMVCAVAKLLFRSAFKVASVALPIYLIYCLFSGKPLFDKE